MKSATRALGVLLCLSCGNNPPAVPPDMTVPEDLTFPKSFLFGTAIAGFQVDMGCPSMKAGCTDSNSDWYVWVTNKDLINETGLAITGEPVTDGPGFYETYPADLDRAQKELSNNALRLSIEWSRVFPTSTIGIEDPAAIKAAASPDGLAYYHALFAAMKARGLKPLVTIDHYTLPTWIHDAYGCHTDIANCSPRGWLDDHIVHEAAKYAGFLGSEFGGEVDLWATLNEPFTAVVVAGYLVPSAARSNPPGVFFDAVNGKKAMVAMFSAHARMYDALKAADTIDADGDGKAARVGIVYNMQAIAPDNPDDPQDQMGAKNLDYLMNQVFLNAVINGDVDANLDGTTTHDPMLAGRMDFLGINYYARVVATGTPSSVFPKISPLLDVDLPAALAQADYNYPRGIYEVIKQAQRWKLPMFITETGVDDAMDAGKAPAWLTDTLIWVKRAIAEGADVEGYFWWTLMDNYEWNHGMTFHLGMYGVDGKDPTKKRVTRQTVGVYSRIASGFAIPDDLAAKYPAPR